MKYLYNTTRFDLCGATENRTRVTSLQSWHNSHYMTTPKLKRTQDNLVVIEGPIAYLQFIQSSTIGSIFYVQIIQQVVCTR